MVEEKNVRKEWYVQSPEASFRGKKKNNWKIKPKVLNRLDTIKYTNYSNRYFWDESYGVLNSPEWGCTWWTSFKVYKAKLIEQKEKVNHIVRDLSISLSVIDKNSWIKYIKTWTPSANLIDIYRALHSITTNVHSLQVHLEYLTNINYIAGHKTRFNDLKELKLYKVFP